MNENDKLRKRSGEVNSYDKLTDFLYILMRDHLPLGTVEKIYQEHITHEKQCQFCNGYLASYAKDLAKRLKYNELDLMLNEIKTYVKSKNEIIYFEIIDIGYTHHEIGSKFGVRLSQYFLAGKNSRI